MAIKIFIVLLFVSFNGYAQTKLKDTVYLEDINGITHIAILHKTSDGRYYYETDSKDIYKYYYTKYLSLRRRGVSDSNNKFYLLLNKLKK